MLETEKAGPAKVQVGRRASQLQENVPSVEETITSTVPGEKKASLRECHSTEARPAAVKERGSGSGGARENFFDVSVCMDVGPWVDKQAFLYF